MAALTAALRELDARLDTMMEGLGVFLSLKLDDLQEKFQVINEIHSTAKTDKNDRTLSIYFDGFAMSNNNYSKCILSGRFRKAEVDDIDAFKHTKGAIRSFMQNFNNNDVTVQRSADGIILTSNKHTLEFDRKKLSEESLQDYIN